MQTDINSDIRCDTVSTILSANFQVSFASTRMWNLWSVNSHEWYARQEICSEHCCGIFRFAKANESFLFDAPFNKCSFFLCFRGKCEAERILGLHHAGKSPKDFRSQASVTFHGECSGEAGHCSLGFTLALVNSTRQFCGSSC